MVLAAMLLSCGGGGGGEKSVSNPMVGGTVVGSEVADPIAATGGASAPGSRINANWSVRVVEGKGHLTVYWESLPGTQAYEVWTQPVDGGTARVSRRFDAAGDTSAWAHTITELTPDSSHRVWVRKLSPVGESSDSPVVTHKATSLPVMTSNSVPAYLPARIDGALLEVDTVGAVPVSDRENYRQGTFSLYAKGVDRQGGTALAEGALEIRGRGNSSWDNHPKKSYRLKLTTSASMLGMPANRHWVLLANHSDKTLLRNQVAFEVSRRMGLAYTPRAVSVELILNGQYLGVYDLAEHVRTGSQRVDIATLGANADDDVMPRLSGGYLLEIDRNDAEAAFVSGICRLAVTLHAPEAPTAAQRNYISSHINQIETVLYSGTFAHPVTGYAAYLDVDSFVNWYLHSELTHSIDAFRYSTFLYKNRGGKLSLGPVWDFDLAMGNFDSFFVTRPGRTDGNGSAANRCWYARLLLDPAFVQKVKLRWQELRRTTLADLTPYLKTQALALQQAQANNFSRWPVLDQATWQNVVVTGAYSGELEYLEWWLQRRVAWMDQRWR